MRIAPEARGEYCGIRVSKDGDDSWRHVAKLLLTNKSNRHLYYREELTRESCELS